MMKKIALVLLVGAAIFTGCSSSKTVTRVDSDSQIDLSGRWNDTDSRLVAEEMVRDGLSRVWVTDFVEENGKKPTVIVGIIRNKTSEHISTETFTNDIEREFINSGKVRVVQGGEEREELRKERADQQEFASAATTKRWGMERGADFILQGTVSSVTDSNGKQSLLFYQTDLELTHLETNEKVWIGSKKIKKVIN
ncbi:penicillin-binding protein activator LpoB [Fulvivirga lutea]|uniref:Penicillin-binding protein activator LpoB n=1 Tax=Fulvivirga lutea TaxID=2810512 RepID=A0A974WEG1_9BACT|nr:penicillin-binding protein activator LpoB [Fulvivirga lutea]QSE96586.1 penicillin-binding protein activator LpoB [Fulvivirga lutea]